MDTPMRTDGSRVRTLREARAWSQEHLAECAGLGVRTVQRVETRGSASNETLLALAAVLECAPHELMAPGGTVRPLPLGHTLGVIGGSLGAIAGLACLWWSVWSPAAGSVPSDRSLGLLGLASGLTFAFVGVICGRYLQARRQGTMPPPITG